MISITIVIVVLTCIISIPAFSSQKIMDDLIFYPPAVTNQNQWYRFVTCGFIHADFFHLAFNMFALYSFGSFVERGFVQLFGNEKGKVFYGLMYILALIFSLVPTYAKHKEDYRYRSLGASGAVSAVIFAGLMLVPTAKVGILFIPFGVPGYIFGPLYLILSTYLSKRGNSGINHSAHIWGALFGVVFIIFTAQIFSDYPLVQSFISQVREDIGF